MSRSGSTTRDLVLIAAYALAQGGKSRFFPQDIVEFLEKSGITLSESWITLALDFNCERHEKLLGYHYTNKDSKKYYEVIQATIDRVDSFLVVNKKSSISDLLRHYIEKE